MNATETISRVVRRVIGGHHALAPGALLRYALVLGAIAGGAEALYLTARHLVVHQPAAWYNPDVRWMAPIVAALISAACAAVLGVLARLTRSGVGLEKATFLFVFPAIYAVVQAPGVPLHHYAKVLLSLGLTSVVARAAGRRPHAVIGSLRWATPAVGAVLAALAAWAMATLPAVAERRALAGLSAARPGSPNVLLLILDTVRAANLSLYGYHRPTSPTIDRWAATGVVFDRAVAPAPWTLPTHATLFTGHYNVTARTGIDRPLDGRYPTLAEILRENGYVTAAFTANLGYTTRTSGLHRGFSRYEDFPVTLGMMLRSAWIGRFVSRRLERIPGYPTWPVPKTAERITDDLEHWLSRRPDRPFFVFLNYYDAHGPYLSPRAYRTRFGPPPAEEATSERPWTTAELATSINAYDGSIAYIDDQLQRVFVLLEQHGLRESTLVVLTSDHGEMFGEHGQTAHTSGLYMPALHVPLAMAYPRGIPAARRVAAPVTLRDVPATVLDIVGLAAESPIPGHSLAALWRQPASEGTPSPVLSEIDHYDWAPKWTPIARGDMRSLVEGRLHYIRNGNGVEELYQPDVDPAEARDLIREEEMKLAVERLRARLDSILGR